MPATEHAVGVGFPPWKRAYVPSFARAYGIEVTFARGRAAVRRALRERSAVLVWGMAEPSWVRRVAAERDAPVWRVEDGFLRSVGLGSDFYEPASLVIDRRRLYFDPSGPSDLEVILSSTGFDHAAVSRASQLRDTIVESGLSKYNVGRGWRPASTTRDVALVIGQVEDDASIQRGTVDVRTNEALLRAVRLARPHSHVVYKPHPDVVSGNRQDSLPLTLAARLSDEVIVNAALSDCLAVADEVHTMTSLVGFEALLRGITVWTYGIPFYGGLGPDTGSTRARAAGSHVDPG